MSSTQISLGKGGIPAPCSHHGPSIRISTRALPSLLDVHQGGRHLPRGCFPCSDSHRHKEGPSKLLDQGPGVQGSLQSRRGKRLLRGCGRHSLESGSLRGEQAAGKVPGIRVWVLSLWCWVLRPIELCIDQSRKPV